MFDPRRPTLRYRLDKGDTLGVFWLSLGSVALCELAARSRPDAIVIDMQHGLWERQSMEQAIGATPSDIPVLVRVAENSPVAIGNALDAGAEGVIVPLVETAKQARAAVAAAHYPPVGSRSGGGVRPLADFVDYVAAANRGIVVSVMIETEKGQRNAKKIAAVDGVDLVFIGTGDLALSIGSFPQFDARHDAACAAIHAACRAEWTLCGTFTGSVDGARMKREQGYRMVVTANDIDLVARGFNQATTQFNRRGDAALPVPANAETLPAKRSAGAIPTFRERLVFDERRGEILDQTRRYMLLKPEALMGLFHHLPESARDEALEALRASIYEQGADSARAYRAHGDSDGAALLDTIARSAPQLGWGVWRFEMANSVIRLEVKNSPFAKGYGKSDKPVCHAIVGMLTAVSAMVLDRPTVVRETECAAMGAASCRFEMRPAA